MTVGQKAEAYSPPVVPRLDGLGESQENGYSCLAHSPCVQHKQGPSLLPANYLPVRGGSGGPLRLELRDRVGLVENLKQVK